MVPILLMLKILFTQDSEVDICSVVLLLTLNPACSSAIISSAWGFSLFKTTFSMTLLGRLMRLMVWQSGRLPYLGSVIISE